jgi:basic membrane protein A
MKIKKSKLLLITLALVIGIAAALAGCGGGGGEAPADGSSAVEPAADAMKVGFIYIGTKNDGGYSQAQNNGVVALQEALGDKIEVKVIESIDDTNATAVKDAAITLADWGASVIVGTSYGFGQPLKELADSGDYDDIIFFHYSDSMAENSTTMMNYFGAMEEPRYLSGMIAGMQTTSNKLGYVAAFFNTEVNIGINAFTLGAQAVNPDVQVEVRYINSWYDPEKETAAAEQLLAAGCDVITQHADTTGPQMAAAQAGKLCVGYNLDNSQLEGLEDAFLTAPIWHHEKFLIPQIESIIAGTWKPVLAADSADEPFGYYGHMKDGYVSLSELTKNVSEDAKAKVTEVQNKMLAGEFSVFSGANAGEITANDGTVLVAADKTLTDKEVWSVFNTYVEGANNKNVLVKGVNSSEI